MSTEKIRKWEIWGFFLIAVVGTLFHFCYEWSGNFKPLALFCAANESVWEHTKMGFWPAAIFALVEYFAFGRSRKNFLFAKALALYVIPITIITIYYLVEAIIGTHILWLDITMFFAAILLSQVISYKLISNRKDYSRYKALSIALLILILLPYTLFTYFPPKLELFRDPPTGGYGLIKK